MPESPARRVEREPYSAPRPKDENFAQLRNGNRKVSVIYGKTPQVAIPAANDNSQSSNRPRDAALRQAANDNRTYTSLPSRERDNSHPTTSEQFSDSYLQQGLQPSIGSVTPLRNVRVDVQSGQNNQVEPTPTPKAQPRREPDNVRRNTVGRVGGNVTHTNQPRKPRRTLNPKKALIRKLPGGPVTAAVAEKAMVSAVTAEIFSWAGWIWFVFQLPLAILTVALLGLVGLQAKLQEFLHNTIAGQVIDWVTTPIQWLGQGASWVLNQFGVDFSVISVANLFMLFLMITAFIGWGTLLAMGINYVVTMTKCLSGKGSGVKWTALLIAVCAYGIPVLNIFPWFLLWLGAVWLYPTD